MNVKTEQVGGVSVVRVGETRLMSPSFDRVTDRGSSHGSSAHLSLRFAYRDAGACNLNRSAARIATGAQPIAESRWLIAEV